MEAAQSEAKRALSGPKLGAYAAMDPRIYAYETPGVAKHVGWVKIGETWTQTVAERIAQQTGTAGLDWRLCWERPARFADNGAPFHDRDFHADLEGLGVERERAEGTGRPREWFKVGGEAALGHFEAFTRRGLSKDGKGKTYALRHEQAEAVQRTLDYFAGGGKAFLWNAKPRFGKTLAAYHLVRRMKCWKVLVVTNRPAVSAGWADDFTTFIGWQAEDPKLAFVSENEEVWQRPGVYSRQGFLDLPDAEGFVAFESLQGLKGAKCFGGRYEKLRWMADLEFDLLIIDEAHEGTATEKTEFAIERIRHRHRLHLSGTPFKQLARGEFRPGQVFTWSYVDEQAAKEDWAKQWPGETNPYERMPRLRMYTYALSPMVEAEVRAGFDEEHQYAFDLNEFFKTKADGAFVYEEKVRNFLRALSTQEKYPFSTEALRGELRHTIWILNRVASVKALKRLLEEPGSGFEGYEVVLAAGDGKSLDDEAEVISETALRRVKQAIANHARTITLSVGQLTVGVTVPEWTGILMLNTCKSPAAYFQATFRVQNPHEWVRDGQVFLKREAYVFDFDPTRTLTLFEQLANETVEVPTKAGETPSARRERKIKRLLNFYPVIGEDKDGRMIELDVGDVLAIPRRMKCQEVVRQGFMCNFLFHNLNLFANAAVYERILNKMPEAKAFQGTQRKPEEVTLTGVQVDEEGNATVPEETVVGTARELFGEKLYGEEVAMPQAAVAEPGVVAPEPDFVDAVMGQVKPAIVDVATQGLKKAAQKRVERQVEAGLREAVEAAVRANKHAVTDAENVFNAAMAETTDAATRQRLVHEREAALDRLEQEGQARVEAAVRDYVNALPEKATELALTARAEAAKETAEDRIRDRLRGFARTIPSFLMAYGDDKLTLANFDTYVEEEAFKELTGITLDEFRLLRDGGERDGETLEGHVFDETVFNDAVQEFLKKKADLSDWFKDAQTEDIFDYIPQQKTNQVFTPREVVVRMVDALERENPGCFDNPGHTFADLYVKSGLFLAEIAKRLYRSPAMKAAFPDDKARLRHIFSRQLYAMAPTRIIHKIVLNYLFGFDPDLRARAESHIVQVDAAEAAQAGSLGAEVAKHFG